MASLINEVVSITVIPYVLVVFLTPFRLLYSVEYLLIDFWLAVVFVITRWQHLDVSRNVRCLPRLLATSPNTTNSQYKVRIALYNCICCDCLGVTLSVLYGL